jgi:hypothetical protein
MTPESKPCTTADGGLYWNGVKCITCDNSNGYYFSLDLADCIACKSPNMKKGLNCITNTGESLSPTLESLAQNALLPLHKRK